MSIELKTASGGSVTLVPEDGVSNTQAVIPQSVGALYGKGNVLGTVSQSGGVPTGAIMESGSNANGDFVLYADGSVFMGIRGRESRSSSGTNATTVLYPTTLAVGVTDFGSAVATLNTGVPETVTNISLISSNEVDQIEVRIARSNSTDSAFYVSVYGRWY